MLNACLGAELLPDSYQLVNRSRDCTRDVGLFILVLLRLPVHMLWTYLIALGIVVVIAHT